MKFLTDEIGRIEFPPQKATVTEVLLMKSDLKPTGSVYAVQQRFPLKTPLPLSGAASA